MWRKTWIKTRVAGPVVTVVHSDVVVRRKLLAILIRGLHNMESQEVPVRFSLCSKVCSNAPITNLLETFKSLCVTSGHEGF